jgi:hypothetical protein
LSRTNHNPNGKQIIWIFWVASWACGFEDVPPLIPAAACRKARANFAFSDAHTPALRKEEKKMGMTFQDPIEELRDRAVELLRCIYEHAAGNLHVQVVPSQLNERLARRQNIEPSTRDLLGTVLVFIVCCFGKAPDCQIYDLLWIAQHYAR